MNNINKQCLVCDGENLEHLLYFFLRLLKNYSIDWESVKTAATSRSIHFLMKMNMRKLIINFLNMFILLQVKLHILQIMK